MRIGALPPFPVGEAIEEESKSTTVGLLRPFEALTLLITAIGHDVGHPGVNNMFLVKTRSPLARLYNDRSVLESYHAAVYCHMLRKLWPAVVDNEEMRTLLISCILSTDMGIHKVYMEKLSGLQEHMRKHGDKPVVGEDLKRFRDVACNLLIKCADISNVVSHKSVYRLVTATNEHRLAPSTAPLRGPQCYLRSSHAKATWRRRSSSNRPSSPHLPVI